MTAIETVDCRNAVITITKEGTATAPRWVVTGKHKTRTHKGKPVTFRASFPECVPDEKSGNRCLSGRTPCGCGKRWSSSNRSHSATHCHGWHIEAVRAFAERIAGTYR